MAHAEKSSLYQGLKKSGYQFDKHYREYSTDELRSIAQSLDLTIAAPKPPDALPERVDEMAELRAQMRAVADTVEALGKLVTAQQRREEKTPFSAPAKGSQQASPKSQPVIATPRIDESEVIRVDEYGNKWFQEEVVKSAYPKPRARRVLRYDDPGVETKQVKVGDYVETFEISGDPQNSRPAEIKITMPSYQTGIYKPPNMPFRVHIYNGVRGFNLDDVQNFYGGADLVPSTVKRCYVSTDLCYDIQSTIRTIENEYRERVLKTKGL